MNADTKLQLLKDEYLLLQRIYEDFDSRALTIKGWSATVGIAAIGVGFYQSSYLWLFAAGSSVVFWFLEGLWKSFQYCHGTRIVRLEKAFSEDNFENIAPLQIYTSWANAWSRRQVFAVLRATIVDLPHSLTALIGITLFVMQHVFKVPLSPH